MRRYACALCGIEYDRRGACPVCESSLYLVYRRPRLEAYIRREPWFKKIDWSAAAVFVMVAFLMLALWVE